MTAPATYTVALPVASKNWRPIPIGAAVHPNRFAWPGYLEALRNYKNVTPEVAFSYFWVHGLYQSGPHDWDAMQSIYNFAKATGRGIFYHCLRWHWGDQPPDIAAWITEAVTRYPDPEANYVVVNEAWDANGNPTIEHIDESYELVKRLKPKARRWYNGFLDNPAEQEQAMGLINRGLATGIGLQWHEYPPYDFTVYADFLCRLRENKIPWRVTEFEAYVCWDATPSIWEAQLQAQAAAYRTALEYAREYKAEAFTTWGVGDADSWQPDYYPMPWDAEYKPKPLAWQAILEQI